MNINNFIINLLSFLFGYFKAKKDDIKKRKINKINKDIDNIKKAKYEDEEIYNTNNW